MPHEESQVHPGIDTPPPASIPKIAVGLLVLCGLTLAAESLTSNSATRIYAWPWYLVWQTAILSLLLAGSLTAWSLHRSNRQVPHGLILVVGLMAIAVSAVASSRPTRSMEWATVWWALVALVMVAEGWISSFPDRRQAVRILAHCLGIVALIMGMLSVFRWGMGDLPMQLGLIDALNREIGEPVLSLSILEVRNPHPFGHWNYLAGACLLVLPWVTWLARQTTGRWQWLWITGGITILVAIISTASRGVFLGLLAMVCSFVAIAASMRWATKSRLWAIGGGCAALCILVGVLNPRLVSSLTSLVSAGSTRVDLTRSHMFRAGWMMGLDHPLSGVGPGMATANYPIYRGNLAAGYEDNFQLHNTPLQIWAEFGLVGMVALAGAITASFRPFLSAIRQGRKEIVSWSIPAVVALAGYAVFSITDFQMDVPMIWLLVGLNVAVLAAIPGATGQRPKSRTTRGSIALAIPLLLTTFTIASACNVVRNSWARHEFRLGMAALNRGDTSQFLNQCEAAAGWAKDDEYYLNEIAAVHLLSLQAASGKDEKDTQRRQALSALQRSLTINPEQEFCYFNLGWLQLDEAPAEAIESFLKSARRVPDREGVYWGLGRSLLASGHREPAMSAFALECAVQPQTLVSPLWEDQPYAGFREIVRGKLGGYYESLLKNIRATPTLSGKIKSRLLVAEWWFAETFEAPSAAAELSAEVLDFIQVSEGEPGFNTIPQSQPKAEPWRSLYKSVAQPGTQTGLGVACHGAGEALKTQRRPGRCSGWIARPAYVERGCDKSRASRASNRRASATFRVQSAGEEHGRRQTD